MMVSAPVRLSSRAVRTPLPLLVQGIGFASALYSGTDSFRLERAESSRARGSTFGGLDGSEFHTGFALAGLEAAGLAAETLEVLELGGLDRRLRDLWDISGARLETRVAWQSIPYSVSFDSMNDTPRGFRHDGCSILMGEWPSARGQRCAHPGAPSEIAGFAESYRWYLRSCFNNIPMIRQRT